MQLLGDAADNPDQRIAEDVKQFIDSGTATGIGILPIGLSLLNAAVTLASLPSFYGIYRRQRRYTHSDSGSTSRAIFFRRP